MATSRITVELKENDDIQRKGFKSHCDKIKGALPHDDTISQFFHNLTANVFNALCGLKARELSVLTTRLSASHVHAAATLFALILVTIAWGTTTAESYSVLAFVRNFLVAPALFACAILLAINRLTIEFAYGLSACVALVVASLLLSVLSDFRLDAELLRNGFLFLTVNGILLLVFSSAREKLVPALSLRMFLGAVSGVLVLTIVSGGFVFEYPPHFVFSNFTTASGAEVAYSQGVSKLFGLAAIAAALLLEHQRSSRKNQILTAILLLFLMLSLLGGGRGDFVSALVVLAVLSRIKLRYLPIIALVAWAVLSLEWSTIVSDFSILERYLSLLDSFGYRNVLVSQVVTLLFQEPRCLIMGCGVGYFQYFYGYPLEMYPHNLVLEFIVAFGIPMAVLLTIPTVIGIVDVWEREGRRSAFLAFAGYFFLIGLKSGGLLTSWMVTASILYLAAVGTRRLLASKSRSVSVLPRSLSA